MQNLRSLGTACVLAIAVTACSSSNSLTGVTPGTADQTQGSHISTLRGLMSPDRKKTKTLLYVSVSGYYSHSEQGFVDKFSVPKYSLVGQITDGIDNPAGLAIDTKGNLYVANFLGNTVTVYPPGRKSWSLTLNVPHPTDVAVGSNGYVYVSDAAGGVDVYPPGATSPSRQLTNPNLAWAGGVAVSPSNNVYASGEGTGPGYAPAVVEFADARGSGKNLGLTGLVGAVAGVIVDDNYLTVSDTGGPGILIYPPGQKSPSSTITVPSPDRPAINKAENEIYVPFETTNYITGVGVYDYPSGTLVATIPIGGFVEGAALSPAATR